MQAKHGGYGCCRVAQSQEWGEDIAVHANKEEKEDMVHVSEQEGVYNACEHCSIVK